MNKNFLLIGYILFGSIGSLFGVDTGNANDGIAEVRQVMKGLLSMAYRTDSNGFRQAVSEAVALVKLPESRYIYDKVQACAVRIHDGEDVSAVLNELVSDDRTVRLNSLFVLKKYYEDYEKCLLNAEKSTQECDFIMGIKVLVLMDKFVEYHEKEVVDAVNVLRSFLYDEK